MKGGRTYTPYLAALAAIVLTSCATKGPAVKRDVQLRNLGITTQGEHAKVEVVDVIQPGDRIEDHFSGGARLGRAVWFLRGSS